RNFILGFFTASALAILLWFWQGRRPAAEPVAAAPAVDAGAPASDRRRHRRTGAAQPNAPALRPSDLHPVTEGDDLATPDVINAGDTTGPEGELPQEVVDARFAAKQPDILGCIEHARPTPDAPVTGRVVVQARIQRAGTVRGVRVSAPAILMH